MTVFERIVVTGASGLLGRLVVADLLRIAPETHVIGMFAIKQWGRTWPITASSCAWLVTRMSAPSPRRSRAPIRCF